MKRIEQYKSRYFEHFGSDSEVTIELTKSLTKVRRNNTIRSSLREENRNCVVSAPALGAGGRRFESCHLDKYCSEDNLVNNPNRVAHFVTHFICRDDNRVDTVNK